MTKDSLADAISKKLNLSKKQALLFLEAFLDIILETLAKGEKVNISGFGSFSVSHRKSRPGVNPRTGEKITIPEMKLPKFQAGKRFKEALRKS
jgi:DNA-binding protein HU-beta